MASRIVNPIGLFASSGRDAQADREVEAVLAILPPDHLARRAFMRGRATMEITHHLRDRRDLAHRLMSACWDHYRRNNPRIQRRSPA